MHRALASVLVFICMAGCAEYQTAAHPHVPAPATAPPVAVLMPAPPPKTQMPTGVWSWMSPPVQWGNFSAWDARDAGGAHIYLRDGASVRELVSAPEPLQVAAWWPGGSGLLVWHDWGYCNSCNADGVRLAALTVGGRLTDLANVDLQAGSYSWSPSGKRLLIGTGGDRFVIDGDPRVLICDFPAVSCFRVPSPVGQLDLTPAWSPDGRFITFARAPAPPPDEDINATVAAWQERLTLWIARADGSGQQQLDTPGGSYPTWSDDGRLIYFVHGGTRWIHNLYTNQNDDTGVSVKGDLGRGWINYSPPPISPSG